MDDIVIKVDHVSKDFILPHDKVTTVKGLFTSFYKQFGGKTRESQHALKDINFEIKQGEFFGIVGRNGSGKSTLLKMLAGIYQPSKGTIATRGKLVPFIELGVGFNPELTGRENVFLNGAMLGFSRKEVAAMYDSIVEFAELERFMDQKLKNYSSGMQVRLAFSMAIRAEADILLVDEVLAVGDADFQRKCYTYFKQLKRDKKTVIFVSHDMNAVEEYCDRAVLIEKSNLVFEGSPHDVAMAYTRMFLDEDKNGLGKVKKRWGNNEARYKSVEAPALITTEAPIQITTTIEINKDIDELVCGFKVRSEDGTAILGTNTKLKRQEIHKVKKGEIVQLSWEFPNMLNTGRYFIDVAAQNDDYSVVYDWWEGAAQISVDRNLDNSYPVLPAINLTVKKDS